MKTGITLIGYLCLQKGFPYCIPWKKSSNGSGVWLVDAAISSVNKNLTCPVDNAQVFKDPAYKKLESLLIASFAIAGLAVQPAVAAIGTCQSLKNCFKRLVRNMHVQGVAAEELAELPRALCFAVDTLKGFIQQVSRFVLLLVHMHRVF